MLPEIGADWSREPTERRGDLTWERSTARVEVRPTGQRDIGYPSPIPLRNVTSGLFSHQYPRITPFDLAIISPRFRTLPTLLQRPSFSFYLSTSFTFQKLLYQYRTTDPSEEPTDGIFSSSSAHTLQKMELVNLKRDGSRRVEVKLMRDTRRATSCMWTCSEIQTHKVNREVLSRSAGQISSGSGIHCLPPGASRSVRELKRKHRTATTLLVIPQSDCALLLISISDVRQRTKLFSMSTHSALNGKIIGEVRVSDSRSNHGRFTLRN
ncbi:hypothetical protein DFH09DRAFT_1402601 [Mycena vulgaris]|nr:hypothetical protein DFH09DRAFT_1402601 [Mycena vulgaris]